MENTGLTHLTNHHRWNHNPQKQAPNALPLESTPAHSPLTKHLTKHLTNYYNGETLPGLPYHRRLQDHLTVVIQTSVDLQDHPIAVTALPLKELLSRFTDELLILFPVVREPGDESTGSLAHA